MNAALMYAATKLLQDPPYPVEQYSTRYNAEDAPVVAEVHPPITDSTPATVNNINSTHQTHNWITQMDDKDLDAFLATCLCGIIVSVLATIYIIWRIIALFMAYA